MQNEIPLSSVGRQILRDLNDKLRLRQTTNSIGTH